MMKNNEENLFTRSEAKNIDEEKIMRIPSPEFTKSWRPYSHDDVRKATLIALTKLGIEVEKKTYSVSLDGANVMALWQLNIKKDSKIAALGWRNSLSMRWSIGYCSIFTVIFCTNQISNGDFFVLRKHTGGLTTEELGEMAFNAVSRTVNQFDSLHNWHEDLKNFSLSPHIAESLTTQALRDGALLPSNFKDFDSLLFSPSPSYPLTLYGFHGALTQVIRDGHLRNIIDMNANITKFINQVKIELAKGQA